MNNKINKLLIVFLLSMLNIPAFAKGMYNVSVGYGLLALGIALSIGIAALGASLGQGKAISSALDGIARNPGAREKILMPLMVGLAFIESLAIYALIVALLMVNKL